MNEFLVEIQPYLIAAAPVLQLATIGLMVWLGICIIRWSKGR
jgi:hypothetical protein